jgi:hypothetical protein
MTKLNYRYINGKIMGLAVPIVPRKGLCKRYGMGPYVHLVFINKQEYYKVHVKRSNISSIKYFKKLEAAQRFVESMQIEKEK